jgi:hypothetical protein
MKISGISTVLVFVLLLFRAGQAISQETITISGMVFDSVTGQELPFAQISVRNSTTGTVTNEEGVFRLEIPARFALDTLRVAYMGYKTLKGAIQQLAGKTVKLSLTPAALQLAEFEIVALTPEEVIRQVVAHIPANYGEEPLILTAFIRSRKFLNNKLAEYTEAIIEDKKTGYGLYERKREKNRHQQSNVPLLLKGRVVSDTNIVNAIGDMGKSAGCLGCNFIHDFVEFYYNTVLDEQLFNDYRFKMEEQIKPEGGKIYHIRFDQKKGVKKTLWKGELIVNASDFALLKVAQKPSFEAYETFEKQKYKQTFTINNSAGWFREMPLLDLTTTYAARNGKYYLNTIHIENFMTFTNPSTGQKVKFSYKNDVVMTEVSRDPDKLKNFKGDKSVGVNQRWDQIVGEPDADFWATLNYLPIEAKLQEEINRLMQK